MLRLLDLFSGIGGFSLGMERTGGFKTVAFCEIEVFPRRVLAKHWPEVPCYHDIRDLTAERLAADGIAVDVISGGFPCQDISIAGKGAGLGGSKSSLWFEYLRLISEILPSWVVIENSPKLRGRGLHTILAALDALRYDAAWDCIPAAYVGAPHRRDRIWLCAHRQSDTLGADADRIGSYQAALHLHGSAQLRDQQIRYPGSLAWRSADAPVQRVVDGIPSRLDVARLGCAGRAIVPQIAELIGFAIMEAEGVAA